MIELLGRLLEFTGDGVYRYGLGDGRILSVNRGFVRLMGLDCEPGEVVGRKLSELMTLPSRDGAGSEPPLGRTEVHGNELRYFTCSGEERWIVHDSAGVVDDNGQRVVEGMMRDITDRKRKEQEQLRALDPHINALVSSGYSNDPVLSDFKRFGFSGVVSKPYRIEELSEALRDAMHANR